MDFLSNFNGIELLFIVILGLLLFGPDKLPAIAARIGKYVRVIREMAADAMAQIQDETGITDETLESANTLRTAFDDVRKQTSSIKNSLNEPIPLRTGPDPKPVPPASSTAEHAKPPDSDLQDRVNELEIMVKKLKSELAERGREEEG